MGITIPQPGEYVAVGAARQAAAALTGSSPDWPLKVVERSAVADTAQVLSRYRGYARVDA